MRNSLRIIADYIGIDYRELTQAGSL